ncbi:MarR family winged helix-turn-helix transcriptional regulator [Tianweitania sediminis]|uniref:HTH marR-type domain-containing protein n=1 Tax=Tianweitania sediminis TaxID=1502156 RepID=A0A8J7R1J7_9HYPH|nr:MarR family transcriptional regulator [Tianweitania sediminis]MBP0438520.1 hypothetical protein [Tianweitania sediminis]
MAARRPITVPSLAERLELACRAMHSIGYAEGLYPAQWTALRYFARAEDGARTASSLARFQGLANGPVSRTVRTLIQKELVRKSDLQPLGRAEHLELTENGAAYLARDPLARVLVALDRLDESERRALSTALNSVLEASATVWTHGNKSPSA